MTTAEEGENVITRRRSLSVSRNVAKVHNNEMENNLVDAPIEYLNSTQAEEVAMPKKARTLFEISFHLRCTFIVTNELMATDKIILSW